jgi:hypothetical protein
MINKLLHPKFTLTAILMITTLLFARAQDKTKTIGNKPRTGSASSSFNLTKGDQVGVKMSAGHKRVQLLKLNFGAEYLGNDSLRFKVNVYGFNDVAPGENLVKQEIYGIVPKGKNRVNVDLSSYNIIVSGNILVAIEWLQNANGDNHFPIGLFNGGTYTYENNKWKKTPVAGVDFNVLVKKLKY